MISQLGNGSLLNAAWFEEVNATLVPSVGVIIQLMLRAAWVPHWKGAGALLHLAFKRGPSFLSEYQKRQLYFISI